MDGNRFDAMIRTLAGGASRRGLARMLGALALAGSLAPLLGSSDAAAKKRKKRRKNKKKRKKKRPSTCAPSCSGKACGDDGCGGSCGSCPGGQSCQGGRCQCPAGQDACGGTCLDSCPEDRARDPNTCGCCRPSNLQERECDTAERDPCCSGLPSGTCCAGEATACPGRALGQPCSFNEQCGSGFCNSNLVCA